MAAAFTHVFRECGNGYPADGAEVICERDGSITLLTVLESSPIHIAQYQANWIYLRCEPCADGWEDLTGRQQDRLYKDLYRVTPILD